MKMKLTSLFILMGIIQTFALNSYSQSTKLSMELSDVSVVEALRLIEDQSEFYFVYNKDAIDLERKVSLKAKNLSIDEILDAIFENTDVNYKVSDRHIILSNLKLNQDSRTISGKVTDSSGVPLPGVTVVVKGTTDGTITDADGNYSIRNVPAGSSLVFSFVGMKTQESEVGNKSSINIALQEETIGLEEVVAIGYGTMKKVNLTGSISNVNAEELTTVPMPTIAQSIMGKASGVFVKNTNGQPGETEISFNIRGFGSPLLIIDGMPASSDDFKQLDPNDIKDFSVLKDAASAAVYGARAGNGVILVTTKRGNVSEAKVTYTGNYGLQFFPVVPDFVSSEQYARMENLSRYNQGLDPVWSEDVIQKFADGSDPNRYPNNDWWSLTLRKYAPQMQHNVNVQGGTDKVKYFVSGGYFYQEAMPRANDTEYKKYNLRSNLDVTLSKKLSMGVDIALQYQDFIGPVFQMERSSAAAGNKSGIMGKIYRHRPFGPTQDQYPDPTILTSYPGADINPVIYSEMGNGGYKSWNTLTGDLKFSFTYQLPLGIEAKANYRLYRRYDRDKQYELKTPVYTYDWDTGEYSLRSYLNDPSRLYERMQVYNNLDQQYYLSWGKEFNGHSVNALAVYEILSDDNNWFEASRIRYDFDIDYLFAGPDLDKNNNGSAGEGGRKGLITRFNYGYKGKYLLELNSRYDASPRFPKETRWGFFPSASVAWRLSEENFIKDNFYFVTNLKLRASYGKLGYDNTGQFQYLETFGITSSYIYDGSTNEVSKGIKADAIPNPEITWEKMATTNVGLDFNLWDSKLEGSFDYFYRKRTDVLGSRIASLPNTVGASLPQVNYAEYDNRGLEVALSHSNKIGEIKYTVGGNISWSREKTGYIDQNEFASQEAKRRGNQIGQWTNNTWGVMTDGFFKTMEEIQNWADQDGKNNATILPGDIRKVDYNGDGRITVEDNVILGRGVFPQLFYGLNMSLSWKSFDFSMLWQGAGLYDFRLNNAPDYRVPFYAGNTPFTYMLTDSYVPEGNPWLPANTDAKFPLYRTDSYNRTHSSYTFSDFWLINGAYIRLKTIELGYTLPGGLLGKWGIDQCKLYLSGYNILTFSALDYMDPEIDTSAARVMGDYYPPVGTYNLGVILKF
jgi:TonB-linked SusC/RagA family outer membrane protein